MNLQKGHAMKMKFGKLLVAAALLSVAGAAQADREKGRDVYRAYSCEGAFRKLERSIVRRVDRSCRGRVKNERFKRKSCQPRHRTRDHNGRKLFQVSGAVRYQCVHRNWRPRPQPHWRPDIAPPSPRYDRRDRRDYRDNSDRRNNRDRRDNRDRRR